MTARSRLSSIPAALLLLAALAWPATAADKVNITPGKDTTVVTGPLNADGTVNYVAYLNAKYAEGVTEKNNAAVLLLKAFGPRMADPNKRPYLYRALGVDVPKDGDGFLDSMGSYYSDHGNTYDRANADQERALAALWSDKDFPLLAEWLKASEQPLKLVTQATYRPRYYLPLHSSSDANILYLCDMTGGFPAREAARALCMRSLRSLGAGDTSAARDDLLTAFRLSRAIARGSTLVDSLVGMGVDGIACKTVGAMTSSGKLPGPDAEFLLKVLTVMPPRQAAAGVIDTSERLAVLDFIAACARESNVTFPTSLDGKYSPEPQVLPIANSAIEYDGILRAANAFFDLFAREANQPTLSARRKALARVDRGLEAMKVEFGRKYGLGKGKEHAEQVMADLARKSRSSAPEDRKQVAEFVQGILLTTMLPSLHRAVLLDDKTRVYEDVARVALAVCVYKSRHGRFPAKLDDLAPEILKTVPQDGFADAPLRYKVEKDTCIIYSVGENGTDDGGQSTGEADDLAATCR